MAPETTDVLSQLFSQRLSQQTTSHIVLDALLNEHDFGKTMFQKTLAKTVLKPVTPIEKVS